MPHTPLPSSNVKLYLISKQFAEEIAYTNQVKTFEVMQRAFDFEPDHLSCLELDKGQRLAWANSTQLVLNFPVNADFGGFVQAAVYNILDWGEGVSRDWHVHSGVEKRDTANEKSSVTVRFWFCSMRSFDRLRWFLNPKIACGAGTMIETIFYERGAHVPILNACAVDGKVAD